MLQLSEITLRRGTSVLLEQATLRWSRYTGSVWLVVMVLVKPRCSNLLLGKLYE